MTVLAQGPLRSTFLQMTHLPTPYWTPVKEGQRKRSSQTTAWMVPRTVAAALRAPPGSPPPTTRWGCRGRSSNTSHPSPSHRRQRRRMSRCWPSRDSRSLWCHVTFINTNQRGGTMATPRCQGWTTSCRTINLFCTPALLAEPWHLLMCCTERLMGAAATPNNRRSMRRTPLSRPKADKRAISPQPTAQPGRFSSLISVQNLNCVVPSSSWTWSLLHSSVSVTCYPWILWMLLPIGDILDSSQLVCL